MQPPAREIQRWRLLENSIASVKGFVLNSVARGKSSSNLIVPLSSNRGILKDKT